MNATLASTTPVSRGPAVPTLGRMWGGVWRLTFRRLVSLKHLLTVMAVLGLLTLVAFAFLNGGRNRAHYLEWTIGFYFTFIVPMTAFLMAAGALRDEIKPATVDFVLVRPIPRPVFVGFKYVSYLVTAQLEYLLGFATLAAIGLWGRVPGLAAALPLLLLAQVLLVVGFSAFGFLCGALTSRYAILGLVYAAVVEVGLGQIPTQLSRLSMTHGIKAMLRPLVAGPDSSFGAALDSVNPAGPLGTTAILLGFSAVALALAAVVFSMRELPGNNEP